MPYSPFSYRALPLPRTSQTAFGLLEDLSPRSTMVQTEQTLFLQTTLHFGMEHRKLMMMMMMKTTTQIIISFIMMMRIGGEIVAFRDVSSVENVFFFFFVFFFSFSFSNLFSYHSSHHLFQNGSPPLSLSPLANSS